jgi:hypothetical protein
VRSLGALAVLVLVLAGCGGTTSEAGTGGADIVPAEAPAFVTIDTDFESSQWRTLDDLAGRFPDKDKLIRDLKRDLLEDEGVDWDKDVRPALGDELALAWLDFENDAENAVALLQPKDEDAFKRLAAKSDGELVYEKFGDWYVFSDKQAKVERFRKASEASDTFLADDSTFKQAMSSFPEDSVLRAFVDGPPVQEAILREGGAEGQKTLEKLGRLDWLVAAVRANDEGVRFDTTVHGQAGPGLKGASPNPFTPSLTHEVPSDALLYFTFHGSKGMLAGLGNNVLFDEADLGPFAGLLRRLDTLLQGENAFYVRPGSGSFPEATFVMEPGKGVDGAKTLDRIFRDFRNDLGALPRPTTVAGLPARKLELGEVDLLYANVGGRLVVTDLPAGIAALKGNPPSLAGSEAYKEALRKAGMKSKTQGFFWVDIRGGIKLAERLAGAPFPKDVTRNLTPLRSAVEYAYTRPSEVQVTFFLRIK